MKTCRFLALLTALFFFSQPVFLNAQGTFTFRDGIQWGMSEEEVKQIENAPALQDTNGLEYYQDVVAGYNCKVLYMFSDDRLDKVLMSFQIEHTDTNEFINDYVLIKGALADKYGPPKEDSIEWKDKKYKKDKSKWGYAIWLNHMEYNCYWRLNDKYETYVACALRGVEKRMSLTVFYSGNLPYQNKLSEGL